MNIIPVALKWLLIYVLGAVLRVNGSDEYKLRRELFKDVDVMVRPVENNAFAVNVSFSLTVSKLMDLVGASL